MDNDNSQIELISASTLQEFEKRLRFIQLKMSSIDTSECVLCALLGNPRHIMQTTCQSIANTCVKCLQIGHGASQCTNSRWQPPQGFCSSCWLPTDSCYALHNSLWGRNCNNVFADTTKFFVTMARQKQINPNRQFHRLFLPARLIPPDIDISHFYNKWLWQEHENMKLPNVVALLERALQLLE